MKAKCRSTRRAASFCLYAVAATAADETPCAKKILSNLARRAYRRGAMDDDVQTLLAFYNRARAAGSFDDGIRSALERVLVSPDFLFRIEADPDGRRSRFCLSRIRCRAGFAIIVLLVEQYSGRHSAGPGHSRQVA